jgi:hypothetical protein
VWRYRLANVTSDMPIVLLSVHNHAERSSLGNDLICRCEVCLSHRTSARIWPLSIYCRPPRVAELRTNLQVVSDLSFSFRPTGGEQIQDLRRNFAG